MNNMIANGNGNIQIVTPVNGDVAGHMVRTTNEAEMFAKTFYAVGTFFCVEDVKVRRRIESTIKRKRTLGHSSNCNNSWNEGSVYFYVGFNSPDHRVSIDHAMTSFCDTVPVNDFKGAKSYKEGSEFPAWVNVTKEEAIEEANKLEEAQNKRVDEYNEERREKIISEYKEWVADCVYKSLSDFKKWRNPSIQWTIKWRKENDIDLTKINEAIDKVLEDDDNTNVNIPLEELERYVK